MSACPTQWTVRGESLQLVVNNYSILQKEWEVCLDSKLTPDVQARILGSRLRCASLISCLE